MSTRITERITLPSNGIGSSSQLLIHRYMPETSSPTSKIYIQSSLHADEIPGLLVSHHLIRLLDDAQKHHHIKQEIVIVPYANPIGLNQYLLGSHIGRFSLNTGVNFNRDWPDLSSQLIKEVKDKLIVDDAQANIKIIRDMMKKLIKNDHMNVAEKKMKRILYEIACDADVVLDLHCDNDAVMHMYTHDRLWPNLSDLAAEIGSFCHLLASSSGGNPFDEVMSCPWAALQDAYPGYAIPMACQSSTIELRGQKDVSDAYAHKDALSLFRFLQQRGYVGHQEDIMLPPVPALLRDASPLDGVDMIEATKVGVVSWKVAAGDIVEENQLLGEIIDIDDIDAARLPIISKTAGLIFGMRQDRLVCPGQTIIKVAGSHSLTWRQGHLLTSK